MRMFLGKRDRSWNHQARKGYLLVTVNHRKHRVYILGFRQIETSRDVTFDEDTAFSRSRPNRAEEVHDEEPKAPRATSKDAEEHDPEDHDMTEPQRPKDPPKEVSNKRRPAWARELIQDVEKYGAPNGSLRESKIQRTYSNYWHYCQTS